MYQVIDEHLINLNLSGETKEQVIRNMGEMLNCDDRLNCMPSYLQSVYDREILSTTGIGFGIAIPHGKCNAVNQTTVAFGRLKTPICWEALDDEPVSLIFAIAVPEDQAGDEHLRIIANLSRKLIHQEFRDGLEQARSNEEVMSLLDDVLNKK